MKVIGIGGYARCGKDTFVSIAKQILYANGYNPIRIAFADTLKQEVSKMLKENNFGLDIYTTDPDLKGKIRPLLVWWGCSRRDLSENGLYWVNVVDEYLNSVKNGDKLDIDKTVILVSDVRFANEVEWVQKKWDGVFIHLKRYAMEDFRDGYGDTQQGRSFDKAPNEEEAKNDPIIQEMADIKVEWESKLKVDGSVDITQNEDLKEIVLNTLNLTKFFKHKTIGILSK